MMELFADSRRRIRLSMLLIIAVVLGISFLIGSRASTSILTVMLAGIGAFILLKRPILSLVILIAAALLFRVSIGTGSAVRLNLVTALIPVIFVFWVLNMVLTRKPHLVRSRTFLPLILFLLMGMASLLIGNATWDPLVPRTSNFLLVQLAQLSIFFLSAAAYLMVANMVPDEEWLSHLTWAFLLLGGVIAVIFIFPAGRRFLTQNVTAAFDRAPFWTLLAALAGGQLAFNKDLTWRKRLLLLAVLFAVGYGTLFVRREVISVWIGVVAAFLMLIWLRFPRFRWLVFALALILLIAGILFPAVYEFAGGDAEWQLSGISRIDLGRRVLEVSMHNPITGLGPASYRMYASVEPLVWRGGQALWFGAVVSSHNNYLDIFSFFGVIGLALFLWFMGEFALLGLRLHRQSKDSFKSGYVNGMLAAWSGIMVLMLFADWFLPFVYNIGFSGFQASILVWVFMGGLVALDNFQANDET